MNHLTRDQLSALLDGALKDRDRAERHLEGCAACRAALASLEEVDHSLAVSLGHDPGEHYFEGFADRVADRIEARAVGAPAPFGRSAEAEADSTPLWWRRLTSPRGLAWVGSAIAVTVVAGVVWMQQDAKMPLSRPSLLEAPSASAPAPPPAAFEEREQGGARAAKEGAAAPTPTDALSEKKLDDNKARAKNGLAADAEMAQEPDARAPMANERKDQPQGRDLDGAAAPQEAYDKQADQVVVVPPRAPAPSATTMAHPKRAEANAKSSVSGTSTTDALGKVEATKPAAPGFAAAPPAQNSAPSTLSRSAAPLKLGAEAGHVQVPALDPPARVQPAAWPAGMRNLVTQADALDLQAGKQPTIATYESSALLWERVLTTTSPGPQRIDAAQHVAWSRFQAFRLGPTDDRKAAARTAVERFVSLAPEGPVRDHYRQAVEVLR